MSLPVLLKKNEFLTKPAVLKQVFSIPECETMLKEIKAIKGDRRILNGGARSLDVLPRNPDILNKIHRIFLYINDNAFNFNLSDIREFSFLEFKKDAFMKWHNDLGDPESELITPNHETRKISLSIQLNDKEYFEGGNILFRPFYPLTLEQGDVIAFPSYLMHKVEPVLKGTRYELKVWANGPTFQ
jgi:hypothetical protein